MLDREVMYLIDEYNKENKIEEIDDDLFINKYTEDVKDYLLERLPNNYIEKSKIINAGLAIYAFFHMSMEMLIQDNFLRSVFTNEEHFSKFIKGNRLDYARKYLDISIEECIAWGKERIAEKNLSKSSRTSLEEKADSCVEKITSVIEKISI